MNELKEIQYPLDEVGGQATMAGRAIRWKFESGRLTLKGMTTNDLVLLIQRKVLAMPFDITLHGHSLTSSIDLLNSLKEPLVVHRAAQAAPATAQPAVVSQPAGAIPQESAQSRWCAQVENEIFASTEPLPYTQWDELKNLWLEASGIFKDQERYERGLAQLEKRRESDPLAPPATAAVPTKPASVRVKQKINKAPEGDAAVAIVSLPTPGQETTKSELALAPAPAKVEGTPEPIEDEAPLTPDEEALVTKLVASQGGGLQGAVAICVQNQVTHPPRILTLLRKARPDYAPLRTVKPASMHERIQAAIDALQSQTHS